MNGKEKQNDASDQMRFKKLSQKHIFSSTTAKTCVSMSTEVFFFAVGAARASLRKSRIKELNLVTLFFFVCLCASRETHTLFLSKKKKKVIKWICRS